MSTSSFDNFFSAATSSSGETRQPYDYQRRLACGDRGVRAEADWLADGRTCESQLISIPTGLGKTAAVVIAWL